MQKSYSHVGTQWALSDIHQKVVKLQAKDAKLFGTEPSEWDLGEYSNYGEFGEDFLRARLIIEVFTLRTRLNTHRAVRKSSKLFNLWYKFPEKREVEIPTTKVPDEKPIESWGEVLDIVLLETVEEVRLSQIDYEQSSLPRRLKSRWYSLKKSYRVVIGVASLSAVAAFCSITGIDLTVVWNWMKALIP